MKIIAISQRIDEIKDYGETRDALDEKWSELFARLDASLVPLPNFPQAIPAILERLKPDGIVLSGGNTPVKYGGNAVNRDRTDEMLIDYAVSHRIPLLGICRGMQSIALYFGSTLKTVEGHVATKHRVYGNICREVNSYHGFSIDCTGNDLAVVAADKNGNIEAIIHKFHPIYGMMWHPERENPFSPDDIELIKNAFGGKKMKTEWDYTKLADAYLKRPDYAQEAIEQMLNLAQVKQGDNVCDVGAGAAHLTLCLGRAGLNVSAVEPNDAMRANGIKRTSDMENISWYEGVGEHTGMESRKFSLVTFGSSFNVCNRGEALAETARILKENGWFACMWNHRDLEDPIQKGIEEILKREISDYDYETRREDQTEVINQSGLFREVHYIEGTIHHKILTEDFIEGWKSHGTVYRQSPEKFELINREIRELIESKCGEFIEVPYTTRIWMAQKK